MRQRVKKYLLVAAIILTLALALPEYAAAQRCKSAEITKARSEAGSKWDLRKIREEMKHPRHSDLVLVTAHRGDWDVCPENTIEGAMQAMDQKLESVELDIRPTQDGVPFLSHDWDLRGEGIGVVGRRSNNLIYTLKASQLIHRIKPDRYGKPAVDDDGNTIYLQSLDRFLDVYVQRAKLMGGVKDHRVVQGATIVLDIKGGEPEINKIPYGDQYSALFATLKAVNKYQQANHIDLSEALLYKINLKAIQDREPFLAALSREGISFQPSLIFIIFPEDWKPDVHEKNSNRLREYQQRYDNYLVADWQNRYPGISLEKDANKDIEEGRGVGAFVSYNTFPEGGRRSDGTCTFDPAKGKECLNQPLKEYASSTIEFLLPAKPQLLRATSLTTDLFANAINYLNTIDRHNTAYIKPDDPLAHTLVQPAVLHNEVGFRMPDMEFAIDTKCKADELLETIANECVKIDHLKVSSKGYFWISESPENGAVVAPFSALSADDLRLGFTIAISLVPAVPSNPFIRSMFSITAPPDTLTDVLVDKSGRMYLGKLTDLQNVLHYVSPMWDPISPCTKNVDRCGSETVYVSFLPNGQVRFDDFALLKHVIARQVANWQAGMSNYGIPVSQYQRTTDPFTAPSAPPAFQAPSSVGLSVLPQGQYGEHNKYKNQGPYTGVRATRISIWKRGILGGDVKAGLETAIVLDQRRRAKGVPPDALNLQWKPCNSGQFQVDQKDDEKPYPNTQYAPTDLSTPCTPLGRQR